MKAFSLLSVLLMAALFSGCASTSLTSNVSPEIDLDGISTFHVIRLATDDRGIDQLIAEELIRMGKSATFGEKDSASPDVEAIVTYKDKWMWDITMYMIELNIQIRNPSTEIAIATGHSLRTSLARKDPSGMVEEVLNEIFNKN